MSQLLKLDNHNYHSNEANQHYMSVSQFKQAMECEAAMVAEIKGEHIRPHSPAMAVGSYLHTAFDSAQAFSEYLEQHHDEIYNMRGNKYKDYEKADEMIETLRNDKFCMMALEGEKEVIYTGELFGVQWKIRVDNINHNNQFFSDIKTTQELAKRYWSEKYNSWVSFVQAYDYILQMYVYREIIAQNTGLYYSPYIVAITKESPPDKAVLHFNDDRFGFERDYIEQLLPSIIEAKQGNKTPHRCEKCTYCRRIKQIKSTFEIEYLID